MPRFPETGLAAVLDLNNWSANVASFLRDITRMDKAEAESSKTSENAARVREKFSRVLKEHGEQARRTSNDSDRLTNSTERMGRSADRASRGISGFTERLIQLDAGIRVLQAGAHAAYRVAEAVSDLAGRANQVQGVEAAFSRITAGMGSQTDLLARWREQSGNMISDLELMKRGNVALINLSQESAEVIGNNFGTVVTAALRGAASTGQDFNLILEKTVKGIRRRSNALLDDIGIWVEADVANQRYAASHNLVVSQMTEAQKAAAWQTEAIRQMNQIIDQSGDLILSYSAQSAAAWENTLNNMSLDIQAGARNAEQGFAAISMSAASMVSEASPYIGAFADVFGGAILSIGRQSQGLLDTLDPRAFFEGGANIIVALGEGMLNGLTFVVRVVNIIAQTIADFLMGFSPPRLGPLSEIDKGGQNVIAAWMGAFGRVSTGPVEDLAAEVNNILNGMSTLNTDDQVTLLETVQKRVSDRLKKAVADLSQGADNANEVRALDEQNDLLNQQIAMLKDKAALEKIGLGYAEKETAQAEAKNQTQARLASAGISTPKATGGKAAGGGALPLSLDEEEAGVPAMFRPYFSGGTGTSGPEEQGDTGFQSTQEGFAAQLRNKFGELEDEYAGFIGEIERLKATFDQVNPFEAIQNFLAEVRDISSFEEFVSVFGRLTNLPGDLITNLIDGILDLIGVEPSPDVQQILNTLGDFAGKALLLFGAATGLQTLAGALSAIKIAATANPVGLLIVAIAGLLAVIDNYGPDALNTLETLAGIIRVAFDELRVEIEKKVDDVRLFFLQRIQELDNTLEGVGIDLVPDVEIDQQIANIQVRQQGYELRDTVERAVAAVLSGEENRIDADAIAAVNLSDVSVSQRVREAVRVELENAINAGDQEKMRILAQTAIDLGMELPPNLPADVQAELQAQMDAASALELAAQLNIQVEIGYDVWDFNDPVFQASIQGGPTRTGGIGGGSTAVMGGRDAASGDISGLLAVVQNKYQTEIGGAVASFQQAVTDDMAFAGTAIASFATTADLDLELYVADMITAIEQTDAIGQSILALTLDNGLWTASMVAGHLGMTTLIADLQTYQTEIDVARMLTLEFAQSLWGIPEGLARLDVHYQWSVPYGGARAKGGEVRPGYAYMVGEEQPEWFVPGMAGQIIPNSQIAPPPVINNITVLPAPVQVGGGMNVTNHFGGQANPASILRTMAELEALR